MGFKQKQLLIGGILLAASIYILGATFCSGIRIPFSIYDTEEADAFNMVMCSLAASYIGGLIIYALTVVLKNCNERKRRKWELDDLLNEFDKCFDLIEEKIDRIDMANCEMLKECKDNTYNDFLREFKTILEKASLYKDIMTEEENDIIAEVRRLLGGLINPPSMMDCDEANRCVQSLKDMRTNIDKLQLSFNKLFERKNSPKPQIKKSIS